jgi:hypothetical protein
MAVVVMGNARCMICVSVIEIGKATIVMTVSVSEIEFRFSNFRNY